MVFIESTTEKTRQQWVSQVWFEPWYPLSEVLCSAGIIEEMGTVVKLCKVPGRVIPAPTR